VSYRGRFYVLLLRVWVPNICVPKVAPTPLPWKILGVKLFQNRHISKAGISAEWSRMAVGDHSSTAIAQALLVGGEISWPACRIFKLGPPKLTYNWRFSINSHIEPTGQWAYFSKRRHFLVSRTIKIKVTVLVQLGESFPTVVKIGGMGSPPFGEILG